MTAPEFSRLVPLARLARDPLRQEIAASADERAALARRLDLISLDHLSATVEVARQGDGTILLTAAIAAEFVQSCVVSLEPVGGAVEERFALRYGPPEREPDTIGKREGEPAFEPLCGEAIDIGEAVAQELALALPPFPRAAGVSVEGELGAKADPAPAQGPFAELARLARRGRG